MQFSSNSIQKRVNSVQRSNKPDWTIPWAVKPDFKLYCALKMLLIIEYYCFDRTRLFWQNAQCHMQGLNKLFLHLIRTLCLCIIMISLKSKKSLQESTNRASECHSPHHIYNSLLRMRAIHELKKGCNSWFNRTNERKAVCKDLQWFPTEGNKVFMIDNCFNDHQHNYQSLS